MAKQFIIDQKHPKTILWILHTCYTYGGMGCSSTNLYTRGLEGSFLELSRLLKPHEAPKGDTPVVPTKHNVPWNGDGFDPFIPLWGKWTSTSPDMKNQPIFFLWTRGSKNDSMCEAGPFLHPMGGPWSRRRRIGAASLDRRWRATWRCGWS